MFWIWFESRTHLKLQSLKSKDKQLNIIQFGPLSLATGKKQNTKTFDRYGHITPDTHVELLTFKMMVSGHRAFVWWPGHEEKA